MKTQILNEKKILLLKTKMNFYLGVVNHEEIKEILKMYEIKEQIKDFYELEASIDTILEENEGIANLATVLYRMLAFSLQKE